MDNPPQPPDKLEAQIQIFLFLQTHRGAKICSKSRLWSYRDGLIEGIKSQAEICLFALVADGGMA